MAARSCGCAVGPSDPARRLGARLSRWRHAAARHVREAGCRAGLCGLLLLAGCAPRITPIGPGYLYEPADEERELWSLVSGEVSKLERSELLVRDAALTEYIEGVIRRLLSGNPQAYLPLKFRVFVLDTEAVNAAAYPTGAIIVHAGILGRIRNEAQLAMLLGHELTHATHRHTYRRFEDARDKQAALTFLKIAAGFGGGMVSSAVSTVGDVVTQASIAGYGRDMEREADQVGLVLLAQCGYDPRAGARLWEQLRESAERSDAGIMYLYASHPRLTERMETCRELVDRLPAELLAAARDVGEERYAAAAHAFILADAARAIARRRYAVAESALNFLRRHRPDSPEVWAWTGWLYVQRRAEGDAERVRSAYARALALRPDYPDALRELGDFEAEQGNAPRARELLERYLRVAPDAPDAEDVRRRIARLER